MNSLQKTIDREKKAILDKSSKLDRLDEYLVSKGDPYSSNVSQKSIPRSQLDIEKIVK